MRFLAWTTAWLVLIGATSADEPHPRLLMRADQVPALRAKLGTSTIKGSIGAAMAATLNGRRSDATAAAISNALAGTSGQAVANAALLCDLQWGYLTDAERASFRAGLLAKAEAVYQESAKQQMWYFQDRSVNNWTYAYGGSPLQVMLYAGLAFPDAPNSAGYVAEAIRLYDAVLCAGPNDGIYDRVGRKWIKRPTRVDMIDESLFSPDNYGLWGTGYFAELLRVLDTATDRRPYEEYGRAFYGEAVLWTYRIGALEGINFYNDFDSFASYFGQLGHGKYQHVGVYSNRPILLLSAAYRDPVLAWHYYSNPSGFVQPRGGNAAYDGAWSGPLPSYDDWVQFIGWGEVAPVHPSNAGWPLTGFWEDAGAAIIRKSWFKNRRVAPPGARTGLVALQAGPGGSKDRPGQGTVMYESDDAVILGCGPYAGSGNTGTWDHFLTVHGSVNNTLFVDDAGQYLADNLPLQRCRHATTRRLGERTFLMDLSPQSGPDFLSAYASLPSAPVYWTRKVHYDDAADILWIKDVASAKGGPHRFRFNWNTTDPTIVGPTQYTLPAGHVMVARSLVAGVGVSAEVKEWRKPCDDLIAAMAANPNLKPSYTPESLINRTIYAGLDADQARITWAIGTAPAALAAYLDAHRGAFVSIDSIYQDAIGVTVEYHTDEPTTARAYRDGGVVPDWSPSGTSHAERLTGIGSVPCKIVIEARDASLDVTTRTIEFTPSEIP